MVSQNLRQHFMLLLLPLSFVYGIIISIRNWFFDMGILPSIEFNFPVISVGNITVGGTGKTPHVEYLIKLLSEEKHIALLSRGYKRKTKGFLLANEGVTSAIIGDEPYQIWQKFKKIKVAVDEKRVRGIKQLKKNHPELQCIILDDAFQHRYVRPGISILLIDYYRPMHNDCILPAGNLRESRQGIHRADIVIVTKVPYEMKPIEKRVWIKELNLFPYQLLFFSTFQYGMLQPVFDQNLARITLGKLENMKPAILLVTGIANPVPLRQRLITCCTSIEHLQYPDHYEYAERDLNEIETRYTDMNGSLKLIITTEKDAVKLKSHTPPNLTLKENMYFIPVEVTFLDEKQEEFDENIKNYVTKNRRINRLHS
jgi:tetraacyldisaccharide 4'-kinase